MLYQVSFPQYVNYFLSDLACISCVASDIFLPVLQGAAVG